MPHTIDGTNLGYFRMISEEYIDSLLNRALYRARVTQYKKYNTYMEIIIAVGAAGSGVSGFALWETPEGRLIWGVISAVSILLATVKPTLKLGDRIELYAKLFGEYAKISFDLKILHDEIKLREHLSEQDLDVFRKIRTKVGELANPDAPVLDDDRMQEYLVKLRRHIEAGAPLDFVPSPPLRGVILLRNIYLDIRIFFFKFKPPS